MITKMTKYVPAEMEPEEVISLFGATCFISVIDKVVTEIELPEKSFIAEVIGIDGEDDPGFIVVRIPALKKDTLLELYEIEILSILILPKRK